MNDLCRHIEVLLLANDCVVVPGLGGFVAHHVCARYDEQEGAFLPPTRTLGFNPQLTMNDSLLVQSYADTYDMSYPEALRRVESEVEDLRKELSERGEYSMHGVGKLMYSHKTITFEPCDAGLLTPTLYALNYLEFPLLARNEAPAQSDDTRDEAQEQRKARVVYIDRDEPSGHAMLNIRVSALRQMAVAAMIAVVFVLAATGDFLSGSQIERTKSGMLSFLYSSKDKAKEAEPTVRAVAVPAEKSAPVQAELKAETYWTIVLCSHVSEKNAKWFREMLLKDGIQSDVLVGDDGNAKVTYGTFASKEDAQETLRAKKKDSKHFEQGWVLVYTQSDIPTPSVEKQERKDYRPNS